jgi:hypothetical protein
LEERITDLHGRHSPRSVPSEARVIKRPTYVSLVCAHSPVTDRTPFQRVITDANANQRTND